jgi:hypothetical protein
LDEKQVHGDMAKSCLQLMSDSLRMNMCDLGVPGALVNDFADRKAEHYLTPDVQYACKYWVQHLQRRRSLGKEHPDTLTSVSNVALMLYYQGEYEAAEEMTRRALECFSHTSAIP